MTIDNVIGPDEQGITREKVTVARSLDLQCATLLSRLNLIKRLKDCLSTKKTRPHIGIIKKLNLVVKYYRLKKKSLN